MARRRPFRNYIFICFISCDARRNHLEIAQGTYIYTSYVSCLEQAEKPFRNFTDYLYKHIYIHIYIFIYIYMYEFNYIHMYNYSYRAEGGQEARPRAPVLSFFMGDLTITKSTKTNVIKNTNLFWLSNTNHVALDLGAY
jgi:hypothetical protein